MANVKSTLRELGGGKYEVVLAGRNLDVKRVAAFVKERIACAAANKCRPGDSVMAKVRCVTSLTAMRMGATRLAAAIAGGPKVAARQSGDGVTLTITGARGLRVDPERIQEVVNAAAACRERNACAERVNPADRWQCVSTLGARVFER